MPAKQKQLGPWEAWAVVTGDGEILLSRIAYTKEKADQHLRDLSDYYIGAFKKIKVRITPIRGKAGKKR